MEKKLTEDFLKGVNFTLKLINDTNIELDVRRLLTESKEEFLDRAYSIKLNQYSLFGPSHVPEWELYYDRWPDFLRALEKERGI